MKREKNTAITLSSESAEFGKLAWHIVSFPRREKNGKEWVFMPRAPLPFLFATDHFFGRVVLSDVGPEAVMSWMVRKEQRESTSPARADIIWHMSARTSKLLYL